MVCDVKKGMFPRTSQQKGYIYVELCEEDTTEEDRQKGYGWGSGHEYVWNEGCSPEVVVVVLKLHDGSRI